MLARNPPWIHIELVPVWVHIKNLRQFVREFCVGMSIVPETADQIAMTTSELLENATKYASTLWARYDLRLLGTVAEISVTNSATSKQRETLMAFVSDVSQGDALDAYIRCLERQSTEGQSQAGLARIRYEAAAEISVSQHDDEICLLAKIPM